MRLLVIASIWLGATLWFGVANTEAGFVADANIDDSGTLTVSFQNDTEQVIKLSNIRIEAPGHPRLLRHVPAPSLHAVARVISLVPLCQELQRMKAVLAGK